MRLQTIYFLFIVLISVDCLSQTDDYVNDNQLRYEDWIYKSNIKTVMLHESSWDNNPAIIALNGEEKLELSFDDLEADKKNYTVSFEHCSAEWSSSELMQSEYLEGFYEANIINFTYSTNTLQKYTHYSIMFPQANMKFTKSGNYILYVYENNNKDNLILTKRFMIYEDKITVVANVKQAIGNDEQYEKQHIDFNIINSLYQITNPFTDLKVVLTQNNRWDNAVYGIKPTFVENNQLTYSLDDKSTFNGGNEFRFFDTRSLRTYTERVEDIYKDSSYIYNMKLRADEVRNYKGYMSYPDLNGGFLIKNQDAVGNPDVDADYVLVHFFFPYDVSQIDGNFYVLGKLTDWRLNKTNRMTYNYKRFGYECNLFIKQGYYNYSYVFLKDGQKAADETLTEGNFWQTENDYTIYVYHRQRGTYYDQLLAVKRLNSTRSK